MSSARQIGVGIVCAGLCLAAALALVVRWSAPLREGLASLRWPSVPGEVVYASYRSDFDPEASSGSEGEARKRYTDIRIAYWTDGHSADRVPYATCRFDTAHGRFPEPGALTGRAHEVRHVLRAGDGPTVRYDPANPGRAVVCPGIPWAVSTLLILPATLLGLAAAFLQWGLAGGVAHSGEARRGAGAGLVLWAVLFPTAMGSLACLLPRVWTRLFGAMLPWWILPAVYLFWLVCFAVPSLVKFRPVRTSALALMLAVPLTLIAGIVEHLTWNHRAPFGTDWSDAEVVQRLWAEHPAIAEDAAWSVMRRNGPREAAAALEQLVGHSLSADARRAAAVALTRIGPVALPALDTVEAALEDPANAAFRDDLERTRKHLRGYVWLQEQVELYRHKLLHDEDGQARSGAAFSLGQIGELAVVAIPDLERAVRDSRNADFADHMQSVIDRLRRYAEAAEP